MNKQSGFIFTEMLMALVIIGALMAIALPNVSAAAKRIATKHEMKVLIDSLSLYEVENGALPSSLSALVPSYYSASSGYDKDQFGVNY